MLEHGKYFIKIGLSISNKSYSHSDEAYINGSSQDSGGSPTVLPFISSSYFHLQSKFSTGVTYHSANGQELTTIHMTGFVGDDAGAYFHEPDNSGLVSPMNRDMAKSGAILPGPAEGAPCLLPTNVSTI